MTLQSYLSPVKRHVFQRRWLSQEGVGVGATVQLRQPRPHFDAGGALTGAGRVFCVLSFVAFEAFGSLLFTLNNFRDVDVANTCMCRCQSLP